MSKKTEDKPLEPEFLQRVLDNLDESARYDDETLSQLAEARRQALGQNQTGTSDNWQWRSRWLPRAGFVATSMLVAAVYFLQLEPTMQDSLENGAQSPVASHAQPESRDRHLNEALSEQEIALELLSDEFIDMEFYESFAFVEWLEEESSDSDWQELEQFSEQEA